MKKKFLSLLLALTVLFSSISVHSTNIYAADGTVKIFLGDSDTPRHHKAIAEGSRSEELSFALKEGTVKTSSFSSDNTNSFKIVKENGKTYIEGIKEGVGYVTLNIETTTGKKYKERLFISIYKGTGTYVGLFNANADVYRGASTNADVENLDDKGDCKKGTKVNVVATCSNFYLIRTMDGSVFDDDKDTGFVEKKYINVQASAIEVDKTFILNVGDKKNLNAKILPNFASDKKLYYSSKNERIATIDQYGNISAKKVGSTNVTIFTEKGALQEECRIVVTDKSEYSWEEPELASKNSKSFKIKANWIGNKKIKVKWKKQVGAQKYIVKRKDGKTKKFKKVTTLSSKKNKYVDKKVKKNKNYWYKIVCKKDGKNVQSNVAKAKKRKKIVLTATANNKNYIKLSWNKSKNIKKITILRKTEGQRYKEIKTLSGRKSSYKDESVSYFTKYKYNLNP